VIFTAKRGRGRNAGQIALRVEEYGGGRKTKHPGRRETEPEDKNGLASGPSQGDDRYLTLNTAQ